jgi:hypothetical protein
MRPYYALYAILLTALFVPIGHAEYQAEKIPLKFYPVITPERVPALNQAYGLYGSVQTPEAETPSANTPNTNSITVTAYVMPVRTIKRVGDQLTISSNAPPEMDSLYAYERDGVKAVLDQNTWDLARQCLRKATQPTGSLICSIQATNMA